MVEQRAAGQAADHVTVGTFPELLQVRQVLQHLQRETANQNRPLLSAGVTECSMLNLCVVLVEQEAPGGVKGPDREFIRAQEESSLHQIYGTQRHQRRERSTDEMKRTHTHTHYQSV